MELRSYQSKAISDVRALMHRGCKQILLQQATGAGKTVIASNIAGTAAQRRHLTYFLCHRRELVDQTSLTFRDVGIPHSFIAANYPYTPTAPVQVCSIDTLKNRLDKVPVPKLVIWDEAHHLRAAGWEKVHTYFSTSYHLGLSATPERLDGKGLEDRFEELVLGPTVRELIDLGHLADYKLFSIPGADTSALHTRMGEFVSKEAEAVMTGSAIMGDIVKHWRKHAADLLTIGFAPTIAASESLAQAFRDEGIMALHLDGNTPKDERRQALRALANGDVRVVWNVGLFGEGFDLTLNSGMAVRVGCVIDASPTQALGAWMQRCARALRPGGQSIILDHAGNALRHGAPCEPRSWTLQGRDAREARSGGGGEERGKQCLQCYAFVKPHLSHCPECGEKLEVRGRKLEHVDGDLEQVDPEVLAAQRAKRREQGQAQDLEALTQVGITRGMRDPAGWAKHILAARELKQHRQRVEEWLMSDGLARPWTEQQLLDAAALRGFSKKWAREMHAKVTKAQFDRAMRMAEQSVRRRA